MFLGIFALGAAAQDPVATRFEAFLTRYSDDWMRFHTDAAAARRYFKGALGEKFERQIEPSTQEHRRAELALIRRGLDELKMFDRARLTEAQKTAADIIAWDLETQRDGAAFDDYYFPFTQTAGAQSNLVSLMTVSHPVQTARDAENYLARLRQVAPRMEENIAEAQRLSAKGLLPPGFILQVTARQIRTFLDLPPAKSPFVATFAEKMARVEGLSGARREQMRAAAEEIATTRIYPAWRRALTAVEGQIPRATRDAGLWRFPNGAEAYNHALRRFTTTKLTAEEIHNLGLRMVAEIETRMDAVLRQLGYSEGSVQARVDKVRKDQPRFPNTPEGRDQYKAYTADLIEDAERRAAALFDRVPKMPVIAQAYPDFMGARAQSYSLGATDGSRPGTYQYPVAGVDLTRFGTRSVAYHEAVPGHHFQGALQAEDPNLPRFLQERIFGNNSAIGEGWGLYAERVAAEEGWYEGDPVGLLGQMDAAVFRARRLVVDTGLHAKRWTREQAIEYLGTVVAGSTESEVERYIVNPAQACSYMIGELKIVELRERAKKELGARFSLREFHNRVLGAGRVPLDILEQEIERWIGGKKG